MGFSNDVLVKGVWGYVVLVDNLKILLCTYAVTLISCSGSVQEASLSELASTQEEIEIDTGGGLMEDEFIPLGVSISTVKDGDAYRGGTVKTISWTIRTDPNYKDLDPGFYSSQLSISQDGGATWTVPSGATSIPGASCDSQELCRSDGFISYDWSIPSNWEGDQFVVKVNVVNAKGQSHVSVNQPKFIIDNTAPVITAGSFTINGQAGAVNSKKSSIKLGVQASDNLSPITEYCLKKEISSDPVDSDPCWVALTIKGLLPSKAIVFTGSDLSVSLGFIGGTFSYYLWFRDKAGNKTTLSNSGAGTAATDKQTVSYTPGSSISWYKVYASNSLTPSYPPVQSELQISESNPIVYVRWGYQWINGGQVSTNGDPIKLQYSIDGGYSFVDFATALEGANGSCDFEVNKNENGCYEWAVPSSLYTKSFIIRVSVRDNSEFLYSLASIPINAGSFRLLAGNTQLNIGGDAVSNIFNLQSAGGVQTDKSTDNSFIDEDGNIYVSDVSRGILKISSDTGAVNDYIKIKSSLSLANDGFLYDDNTGIFSNVKISGSYSVITLDDQKIKNPLLIFEPNRIRRITLRRDPKDNIAKPYLESFIGANGVTGNGKTLGTLTDRCVVYDANKKLVTSFSSGNPRSSCILSSADKAKGYQIYYTATDPEKIRITQWFGHMFWQVLPNGSLYFLRSSWATGQGTVTQDYDIRVYKYDKTKSSYRLFPLIISGKGTLKNCSSSANSSGVILPSTCQSLYFNPIVDLFTRIAGISFNALTSYVNALTIRMTDVIQVGSSTTNNWYSSNVNPYSGIANGTETHYPDVNPWFRGNYATSRRGDLYRIHNYDNSLYKVNSSNSSWARVLGNGVWSNDKTCADGTSALACSVKLQDALITSDNTILFWDNNVLRIINNSGTVSTLFGQKMSSGENVDPLLARIGDTDVISLWGADNRITFFDKTSLTFREIEIGNSVKTIAGNEQWKDAIYTWASELSTKVATDLHLYFYGYWGRSYFIVDKENGTLFTTEYAGAHPNLIKLDRSTGKWSRIFGKSGGTKSLFTASNNASTCDDNLLSSCRMHTSDGWSYSPHIVGYVPERAENGQTYPQQMMLLSHSYSSNKHLKCYVKSIFLDSSINKAQHFMGNEDQCYGIDTGGADNHYPDLSLGDSIQMSSLNKFPSLNNALRMVYMPYPIDGWLTAEIGAKKVFLIKNYRDSAKSYQVTRADVMTLYQPTANTISSFNLVYDNGTPVVVYCSGSGSLYKIKNNTETQLPLPTGYTCYGKSIEISYDGKKIVFPINNNKLKGIGEYELF